MRTELSGRFLGHATLLLGLALGAGSAQAERSDRGADYGDRGSDVGVERGEPDKGRGDGGWGEHSGGRGEREQTWQAEPQDRGDAWQERGASRSEGWRGESRGEANQMERIAGFQGGHREPEHRGGREPQWQGDRWGQGGREHWNSGQRRDDARHWQSDRDWRNEHRGRSDWGHDDYRRNDWHHDNRYRSDWRRDWRNPEWRRHWRHGWGGHRYRAEVRYTYPRGYRSQSWRIGYRLPSVFFASDWYVDWRYYRLAAPPWGCRWLRVDGDLLLVDERSGEIVDVLYGFFYY